MSYLPAAISNWLVVLVLLLVPVWWLTEKNYPSLWNERLWQPPFTTELKRHTVRFNHGTYLPARITSDHTYVAAQSPLLLTTATAIPAGVTVTMQPGTHVWASEFASLTVEGALNLNGTAREPIIFSSNELHPLNHVWAGIIFAPESQAVIEHAEIHHAFPGISCFSTNTVKISHSRIEDSATGLFIASPRCKINDTFIRSWRNDILE